MGQLRDDMVIIKQVEQEIQEVARHYGEKYKEANEVLKLRNTREK